MISGAKPKLSESSNIKMASYKHSQGVSVFMTVSVAAHDWLCVWQSLANSKTMSAAGSNTISIQTPPNMLGLLENVPSTGAIETTIVRKLAEKLFAELVDQVEWSIPIHTSATSRRNDAATSSSSGMSSARLCLALLENC